MKPIIGTEFAIKADLVLAMDLVDRSPMGSSTRPL
jgi:hypothetical protein